MSNRYSFEATCERCGDTQHLTPREQDVKLLDNGSFVCDVCEMKGYRPRPTRRAAPRPPRPSLRERTKPAAPKKPPETRCCLKGLEPPTYFRPCPGCPDGLDAGG